VSIMMLKSTMRIKKRTSQIIMKSLKAKTEFGGDHQTRGYKISSLGRESSKFTRLHTAHQDID